MGQAINAVTGTRRFGFCFFLSWEGLAVSEVFYLAEQHPGAKVIMDHTVEEQAAREVAQHCVTLRLNPEAMVADVVREISSLSRCGTMQ